MARVFESMEQLIGHTPLMEVKRLEKSLGLGARILVKVESFNPAGSVKDRAALEMLNDAEKEGILHPGATIIEPTSGNTGIGLAAVGAVRGYKTIIVMPDTMSVERRLLMQAYGAQVVLSDGKKGMAGAIEKAEELAASCPGNWIAGQFVNPANARAHYLHTGPEIFADTDGCIDAFVAGVGTGGTITGIGEYLKEQNPQIRIVAVEPSGSPVLSGGQPGGHGLQGIGAGFVPHVLDRAVLDEIIPITEQEAYEASRLLARMEGLLTGISSGAALAAAIRLGKSPDYKGKTIVTLLPDTGERYLSTPLYTE